MASASVGTAVALGILAILCFGNSLFGELVWDDIPAIVENGDVLGTTGSARVLLAHDFWGHTLASNTSHKSWRPITTLTFRVQHAMHGLTAWPYHLVNVALHALMSFLVAVLADELCWIWMKRSNSKFQRGPPPEISSWFGRIAAGLFVVHPVHVEAVANVVGRAELMSGVCYMGSIICYMRYSRVGFPLADPDNGGTPPPNRKKRAGAASERADKLAEEPPKGRKRSVVRLVATLGMAGAGMLCKEQAVTALGVCVAYELLCVPYNAKTRPLWTSPKAQRCAVLLSAAFALLTIRGVVCGGLPQVFSPEENPAAFHPNVLVRGLTYCFLYVLNAKVLLWPAELCIEWGGTIPLVQSIGDPRNFASLALLLMLTALALPGVLVAARSLLFAKSVHPSNLDSNSSTTPSTPTKSAQSPSSRSDSRADAAPAMAEYSMHPRVLAFLVALLVLPFLPSSNLFLVVGFMLAERVLYLPSVGFCLLVALGFHTMLGLLRGRRLRAMQAELEAKCATCANFDGVLKSSNNWRELVLWRCVGALVVVHAAKCMERSADWRSSEALFSSGRQTNPGNYKMHYSLGVALAGIPGREKEAEAAYRASLELKPTHANAYNNLGLLLNSQQRYQEAADAYHGALAARPTHAKAMSNLGMVLQSQGQPQEAEQWHLRSLELNPHDHKVHNNLGLLYSELRRFKESERHYHHALQIAPDTAMYHNNLGALHFKAKNYPVAEQCYRNALRLAPTYTSALKNLVLLLHDQGNLEHHQSVCSQPAAVQPSVETQQTCTAIAYAQQLGQIEQEKAKQRASQGLHSNDGGKTQMAEKLLQSAASSGHEGRLDEAIALASQAIKIVPSHSRGHNLLARLYLKKNDVPAAEVSFMEAIRLNPNMVDALDTLGVLHAQRGELKKATQFYDQALKTSPDYVPALRNLGVVLREDKKFQQAKEVFQKAIDAYPSFLRSQNTESTKRLLGDLYNNMGVVLVELSEWAEAKTHFELAIARSPGGEHTEASANLGYLLSERRG